MRLRTVALLVLIALASSVFAIRGSETLAAQLTDAEYWKIISEFSEPSGYFQHEIVTSNEISYQYVLPKLVQRAQTGGANLGVGPEQNFTYGNIASLPTNESSLFIRWSPGGMTSLSSIEDFVQSQRRLR